MIPGMRLPGSCPGRLEQAGPGSGGEKPAFERVGERRRSVALDARCWRECANSALIVDDFEVEPCHLANGSMPCGIRSVGCYSACAAAQRQGRARLGNSTPIPQNFSEPTKEVDAAMRTQRIQHDGNPVLEWCVSNVVGRYDVRSNVYPRKARPEQKIDAAIALTMGTARCMAAKPFVSVYETRGLIAL